MRFLCFSFLSPPATDAESACTGRFLSALADAGHEVKLISLDYRSISNCLEESIEKELLDGRIEVERIAIKHTSLWKRVITKIRYGLFGICTEYIDEAVRITKSDLLLHPDTILITRSAWPASNIVGWYCRKHARAWIPHFSDPFPSYKKMKLREVYRYPFAYFWLIRILRDANFVTVTCHNAIRYFNEITFRIFNAKFHITYHIGFPRLQTCGYAVDSSEKEKVIVHVGALFSGRPVAKFAQIVSGISGVKFVQYGSVFDQEINKTIEVHRIESPRMATDAMATADAILVCDLDSGFGYTPYLPSKFAYALALNRPIICLTTEDSEMAQISQKVPGVYFVDMKKGLPNEAVNIIQKLKDSQLVAPSFKDVEFASPKNVEDGFLKRVRSLSL